MFVPILDNFATKDFMAGVQDTHAHTHTSLDHEVHKTLTFSMPGGMLIVQQPETDLWC